MTDRDKSLCHIEQVPQFRSPLIILMFKKQQCAWSGLSVLEKEKSNSAFISVEIWFN